MTNWVTREGVYNDLPIPLQNVLVAWRGWQIYRERFGRKYKVLSEFLEASESASPEEHRDYQEKRLRKLIGHAYDTVPHYRRVMDERGLRPSDIRSAADLRKLPVLTKDDVRELGDDLVSSSFNPKRLREAWTSATSASPLPVRWDHSVALMNHACYMRIRRWAGVPFGRPFAAMQGKPVVPIRQKRPPFWRHNPVWNQVHFSAIALSDETLPHYVRQMRRSKIEMLETYPSCAYVMARFLEDRGEYLPMTCLITTGEPLLPNERAVIEERFRAPVFDAYGQAERVVFSSECEKHDGHHIYPEYGITEFLDGDGNEVPEGEFGSIVGTGLHNFAMPLIRYATGDVAAQSDRVCSCGRTLPMFEGLTSREGDILVAPDGRMVPPIMVGWISKILDGVTNWQVIQESTTEFNVFVVRDRPVTEQEYEGVRQYVSRRLSPDVNVSIEIVDEIPRGSRGKSRHVISRVPLVWGVPNRSPEESDTPSGDGGASDRGTR